MQDFLLMMMMDAVAKIKRINMITWFEYITIRFYVECFLIKKKKFKNKLVNVEFKVIRDGYTV